jgi:RNA recognition motif-containing protein
MRCVTCIFLLWYDWPYPLPQYDANSTGPPPPTAVLITNLNPFTPREQIRRHFGAHGTVVSFEPQIDNENGATLGIVYIKYDTHEQAKKCATQENGRRLGTGSGLGLSVPVGSAD